MNRTSSAIACTVDEGIPMQADERTRTVVHREWILKTPAHHTEVTKVLAAASQMHDAEPGHPSDIEFTHGDAEIVIGYRVERDPAVIADAVDKILRAERDLAAERLSLARQALARHPHFDGSPIGNDVAARITELLIHLDGRVSSLAATIDRVRAVAASWNSRDHHLWWEISEALGDDPGRRAEAAGGEASDG